MGGDIISLMLGKLSKLLFIAALVLPLAISAQTGLNMGSSFSNELQVQMAPAYPKPNQTVDMSLALYTGDLNSATISWYKDGNLVLSGKGETRYSFKTGNVGQNTKIVISVKLLNGIPFSKTLDINPVGIDLIWEANSYVPPFYKGKALHPKQGSLKIVAMPEIIKNGKKVDPGNLIYQWSNLTQSYQSQSGYGKNTLVLSGSLLGKSDTIKVIVTEPVSGITTQNMITIDPAEPKVVLYEIDPYYGHIFDTGLPSSFAMRGEESQILAAPYFFTKERGLTYKWRLNNQAISDLDGSMTAIFRKPEDKDSGTSKVSLQVTNINRILQMAERNLSINFGK